MQNFVTLMSHPPKTILRDQDPRLTEAIAKEMSPTKQGRFEGVQGPHYVDLAIEDVEQIQLHDPMLKNTEATWGNKLEVFWDGNVAKCSCKNYDFVGILCRHILCVLIHEDCFNIPITYWPFRWSREVVSLTHNKSSINSTSMNNDEPVIDANMVNCPPKSKPKGRPKNKRVKGGIDSTKRRKYPSKEKRTMDDAATVRASKKRKSC
ncbi:protein FAR1-related sequence 11 [Tanacetum coccineum]